MLYFDNTLKIKQEAEQNRKQFNQSLQFSGLEQQQFNVNDKIITDNTKSTIILTEHDNAIITDTYTQNGFYYYIIRYNISKRKTATVTLRQKDIIKI